jgi:peptidoglycan/LPS O-acetylase OafA/YrhL
MAHKRANKFCDRKSTRFSLENGRIVKRNKSIQTLRGIAIIGVILFHSKEDLSPNGYLGVDLFFLISGYLIIPRIVQAINEKVIRKFYVRRFERLAPALLFMLIVSTPLVFLFGSWSSHGQYLIQGIWTLLLLGNLGALTISGNYFNPDSFMPLVHTWSLAVEEQVYLLLPLVMRWKARALPVISGVSFILFLLQDLIGLGNSDWFFYMILSRIWEFYVGFMIFKSGTHLSQGVVVRTSLIASLIMILLVPIKIPDVLATCLVLAISWCIISQKNDFSFKYLELIGARAYSLYLFHMPILYLAKFSPLTYGSDRAFHTMVGLIVTVLFAEFTFRNIEYRWVERNP